jgi:GNAT superfamily N-acetyltransferase
MSVRSLRLVPVSGLSSDPVERARFDAWAAVFAAAGRHDADEDPETADELRAGETDPTKVRLRLVALEGEGEGQGEGVGGGADGADATAERALGALNLVMPTADNLHLAWFELAVRPEHRRLGIGARLLEAAEATAREHGRSTMVSESKWSGQDHLLGDVAEGFAQRFGYTSAQTMRRSDYAVPAADEPLPSVSTLPPGYAVETHVGTPPEADRGDRAWLARRMSTDAPVDDLDLQEEEWDEARIADLDGRLSVMERGRVSAFARHAASGRLVAFTEIQVPRDSPDLAYQEDTLVLREHRGHGLGLALKLANLAVLREAYPAVRRIRTWNAVGNTHMLAVNEAMGFHVVGFVRLWQKVL